MRAKIIARIWVLLKMGFILFMVSSFLVVFLYRWINPSFTSLMLDRESDAREKNAKYQYHFIEYDAIPSYVKLAFIASEDQKFSSHFGFDFESITKAFNKNLMGKKIIGASTISQQTAKNLFLWEGRNLIRKSLEAYFTFLIELVWGKERILEVYMNIIETGYLTFGIESAAKKYFNKPASRLTLDEAALIAAVLPNPVYFKVNKPTKFILKRKEWIKRQVANLGGKKYLKRMKVVDMF